jgi:riboflavin synthase
MFTGIVAAVGSIKSVTPLEGGSFAGVRLDIDAGGLPLGDVALGDSIAINGACMTVVEKNERSFAVDVSRESLNRTAGLDQPGEVNLEKALTLATSTAWARCTLSIRSANHTSWWSTRRASWASSWPIKARWS